MSYIYAYIHLPYIHIYVRFEGIPTHPSTSRFWQVCIHIYICVCMYVCMYVCIYIYIIYISLLAGVRKVQGHAILHRPHRCIDCVLLSV